MTEEFLVPIESELWERQKGESTKAFMAFCVYRDMGAMRSIRDVAARLHKSPELIGRWSRRWSWVDRCVAYDNYMSAFMIRDYQRKLAEVNDATIKLTTGMQVLAAKRLKTLDISTLSPKDLASWVELAARLQLRAMGQPTNIVQQNKNIDIKQDVKIVKEEKKTSTEETNRIRDIMKTLQETGVLNDFIDIPINNDSEDAEVRQEQQPVLSAPIDPDRGPASSDNRKTKEANNPEAK